MTDQERELSKIALWAHRYCVRRALEQADLDYLDECLKPHHERMVAAELKLIEEQRNPPSNPVRTKAPEGFDAWKAANGW